MARARDARRYLLDPRFQLKWTSYLVVIVLAVMASLGVLIGRVANRAADTAQVAVSQAEKAFEESKTNNVLTRRTLELAAPDNAMLTTVLNDSLGEVDQKAEQNLAEVRRQEHDIALDRRKMKMLLAGSGVALVFLLSLMGVLITHRIVGPVHKMKRLLRRVSTGRLVIDDRLRKGDELEDLFETFLQMTHSLRAMQNARVATLDATLRRAEQTGADIEVLQGMRALRAQMVLGMERRRTSIPPPFNEAAK